MNTTPGTPPRPRLAKDASDVPAYDLSAFKSAKLRIAGAADEGAADMDMTKAAIYEALGQLTPAHFFKSMVSEKNPGVRMDVYHLPHHGRTIYVKFARDPNGTFALTSFNER
jgi:hypothetical protein